MNSCSERNGFVNGLGTGQYTEFRHQGELESSFSIPSRKSAPTPRLSEKIGLFDDSVRPPLSAIE